MNKNIAAICHETTGKDIQSIDRCFMITNLVDIQGNKGIGGGNIYGESTVRLVIIP